MLNFFIPVSKLSYSMKHTRCLQKMTLSTTLSGTKGCFFGDALYVNCMFAMIFQILFFHVTIFLCSHTQWHPSLKDLYRPPECGEKNGWYFIKTSSHDKHSQKKLAIFIGSSWRARTFLYYIVTHCARGPLSTKNLHF